MRPVPWSHLDPHRIMRGEYRSPKGSDYGAFKIDGPNGRPLIVMASPGNDKVPWEHVSVSLRSRTPNWQEMCFVKDLFWTGEEAVLQFHPPRGVYVNDHPYCLHLYRPLKFPVVLPPSWTVGRRDGQTRAEMEQEVAALLEKES